MGDIEKDILRRCIHLSIARKKYSIAKKPKIKIKSERFHVKVVLRLITYKKLKPFENQPAPGEKSLKAKKGFQVQLWNWK